MEIPSQLRFVFVRYRDNYAIFLFNVFAFLMTLELHYILGRSNYVRKLQYKVVCNQKITKNYVIT